MSTLASYREYAQDELTVRSLQTTLIDYFLSSFFTAAFTSVAL
jgi:hypothetical protein